MLIPLQLQPGINKEQTDTVNEGTFVDGNRIRFWQGMPESIGGWVKASDDKFTGICRGMLVYEDTVGNISVAIGTHRKLEIWRGGRFFDITPLRRELTISNPFTTVAGSSIVTVDDNSHGANAGDIVVIGNSNAVGGVTVQGNYEILTATSDSYTIDVGTLASASTTGGGSSVDIGYYINIGAVAGGAGTGFGVGTYGRGTFGTPRTNQARNTRILRSWSFDAWGEDLVANFVGGPIFLHDTSNGTGNRAQQLPNAPKQSETILVSDSRQIIAYGAESGGIQDRMLVRWCDINNYNIWAASLGNSAGSYRLQGGSRLMAAVKARGDILVFSDTHLHLQHFSGAPYIYTFTGIGENGNLIASKAVAVLNNVTYWMGQKNFMVFDGRISTLPSPVQKYVYDNINKAHRGKIFAAVNADFNEVMFFYPDLTSVEPNRYVSINTVDGTWSIGEMSRTSWIGGRGLGFPVAVDSQGYMYYQEFGDKADGAPLISSVKSAYIDLGEGDRFLFWDKIIPDFKLADGASVSIKVYMRKYPNKTARTKGPFNVTNTTEKISSRGRGRQVAVEIISSSKWRMGKPRFDVQPDGNQE